MDWILRLIVRAMNYHGHKTLFNGQPVAHARRQIKNRAQRRADKREKRRRE